MTPLHALERELLRECARRMRAARRAFGEAMASNATYANGEPVEQWSKLSHVIGILRQIPWPAAQYRDLRDARRMLAEIEDNVICCFCGVEWGHAPGCALERVVGDG